MSNVSTEMEVKAWYIELTRKVVEYAHSNGVVVEAELGKLAGIEDDVNVSAEDAKPVVNKGITFES